MGRHRSSRKTDRSTSRDRERKQRSRSRSRSRERRRGGRDKSADNEKERKREEKRKREEERKRKEEEKRKAKETETPEERRRRRLAKKAEKERLRKEDNEVCGYTNDDNPFGDSRLTQRFQWKKRDDTRVEKGLEVEEYSKKRERERRKEIEYEVQKVKRRRQEREEERRLMEKERERMNRMRDAAENLDWHRQENEFHLNMSKMRTAIRLQDGRARPIDTLSKNLGIINPDNPDEELEVDVDLAEPYKIFTTLSIDAIKETIGDIEEKIRLGDENSHYWQLLLTIARDHERSFESQTQAQKDQNAVVQGDMQKIFAGKSVEQLSTLQEEIEHKLETDANIDHTYWQLALSKLKVHKAKAELRDMHAELLGKQLERLEAQIEETGNGDGSGDDNHHTNNNNNRRDNDDDDDVHSKNRKNNNDGDAAAMDIEGEEQGKDRLGVETDEGGQGGLKKKRKKLREKKGDEDMRRGRAYTPTPFASEDKARAAIKREMEERRKTVAVAAGSSDATGGLPPAARITVITDPELDALALRMKRDDVLAVRVHEYRSTLTGQQGGGRGGGAGEGKEEDDDDDLVVGDNSAEAQYRREIKKLGGDLDKENEDVFTDEAFVPERQQAYTWEDKYRPRKPRYFNRVRTGYEWNKYNQTHYDQDNPPPKTVQGYKFNIFYPDLIDDTKTPTYHLSAGPTPDTAILRFSGGPPYEDIAFVIPNKEWITGHRRGFKCTFERGVLHLWFNFSRAFYRR